jgi:hypothetical protein
MTTSGQNTLRIACGCIEALNQGDKERLKANLALDAVYRDYRTMMSQLDMLNS